MKVKAVREENTYTQALFSRREAIVLLGAASVAYLLDGRLAVAQTTARPRSLCIVRPEQTEGPYFVDEKLHRSDIRFDPSAGQLLTGMPFTLTFQVSRLHAGKCRPLPDAQIDVWHCDAMGVYSDVRDPAFNTLGRKFLRGYQLTDSRGEALFRTIYPGWYPIRTVHIHFKIRTAAIAGKSYEFTSQLYFPDDLSDRIYATPLYSSRGRRRVRNHHDFIFRDDGEQLMLEPLEARGGYTATFPIGLAIS